jgi:hypothetical protein
MGVGGRWNPKPAVALLALLCAPTFTPALVLDEAIDIRWVAEWSESGEPAAWWSAARMEMLPRRAGPFRMGRNLHPKIHESTLSLRTDRLDSASLAHWLATLADGRTGFPPQSANRSLARTPVRPSTLILGDASASWSIANPAVRRLADGKWLVRGRDLDGAPSAWFLTRTEAALQITRARDGANVTTLTLPSGPAESLSAVITDPPNP